MDQKLEFKDFQQEAFLLRLLLHDVVVHRNINKHQAMDYRQRRREFFRKANNLHHP